MRQSDDHRRPKSSRPWTNRRRRATIRSAILHGDLIRVTKSFGHVRRPDRRSRRGHLDRCGCGRVEATGLPQQQTQATANGQTIGGMSCDAQEGQRIHIHQHLVMLDHGKPVAIPASDRDSSGQALHLLGAHPHARRHHSHRGAARSVVHARRFLHDLGRAAHAHTASAAHAAKGESLKVWVNGKPYKGDPAQDSARRSRRHRDRGRPALPKPTPFTNWGPL